MQEDNILAASWEVKIPFQVWDGVNPRSMIGGYGVASFYPEKHLHREAFTHSKLLHTEALHTASFYTEKPFHREAFTQRRFYTPQAFKLKVR